MRLWAVVALSTLAAACGGGGGGGEGSGSNSKLPPGSGSGGIQWTPGVFQPASRFEAQCASPRSGIDPGTGSPYPDVQGSTASENHWLRSWTHDLYLWYDEVPDLNPSGFSTLAYFDLLKTTALTPSGNPKDRFHFTMPTAEWELLSQSGISAGYGAQFVVLAALPPRRVVVAYTEPGSPAAQVNLQRGAEILRIDGADVVNGNTQAAVDTINAGLLPQNPGETHQFTIRTITGTERTFAMTAANVTSDPVQNVSALPVSPFESVGYMLFNDHLATAEAELIDAIHALKAENVTDLILDLRYNSGGFLDIAAELAYMIAGPNNTAGRIFERVVFNAKHPSTNPVTREPLLPVPFHSTTVGFPGNPPGVPLPTLNLARVFVLTGPDTCSASESIINGLRGADVEVIQIGSMTCGKPYGFYPTDNCGTTYFSIQFRGENHKSFGDYGDGFSPENTVGAAGHRIPGCSVADDFSRPLGDPFEGLVAAALQYRNLQTCPTPSGFSVSPQMTTSREGDASLRVEGLVSKPLWLENRILRSSR